MDAVFLSAILKQKGNKPLGVRIHGPFCNVHISLFLPKIKQKL